VIDQLDEFVVLVLEHQRVEVALQATLGEGSDLALGLEQVAKRSRAQVEGRVEAHHVLDLRCVEVAEHLGEVLAAVNSIRSLIAPLTERTGDRAAAVALEEAHLAWR